MEKCVFKHIQSLSGFVLLMLGSRQEIIPQDCAGFWFVYKAHPLVHIRICAGGCNAVDGPKDKQDV
jgi:hypothetical protein